MDRARRRRHGPATSRSDVRGWSSEVLEQVRAQGPIAVGDVEGRVAQARHVVELGRRQGGAGDAVRPGCRQRHPPPERLRPPLRPRSSASCPPTCSPHAPAPEPEARRQLLLLAARSLGVATLADLVRLLPAERGRRRSRSSPSSSPTACCPVEVDGWDKPAFLHPEAATPRRVTGRALLSPVRLARLVPRAHRAAVRLQLPHRDLHAEAEADLRLLRAAVPARRPARRPCRPQGRPRRRRAAGPGQLGRGRPRQPASTARRSPSNWRRARRDGPLARARQRWSLRRPADNLAKDSLDAPNVMPIVESDA